MPDDIPLEEPARRMTVTSAAPRSATHAAHAWQRTPWLWDVQLGMALVTAELFVAFSHGSKPWITAVDAWLLLSVPLYATVGRPALHRDAENSRRALSFCTGMAVLYTPAAVIAQETSIAMVVLAPLSYLLLSRSKAIAFLLVYNFVPPLCWTVLWWDQPEHLLRSLLIAASVAGSCLTIGGWVQNIAVQSSERADLLRRLESSRDELARLSTAHGALLERERLAREIHDTLAQGFTSLVMLCQALRGQLDPRAEQARRYVDLMHRTARENLAESRSLVSSLSPAQLDDSALDEAVRRLGERLAEELGIIVDVHVTGTPRTLPPTVEVVALRASQEALSNIRKHAHAAHVDVCLAYTPAQLELTVRDDGRGFSPTASDGGYGLPGMRARVTEIGGTTEVISARGQGTTLTVRLPQPPSRTTLPLIQNGSRRPSDDPNPAR
ncbi:sensor histidine kinase [Streptomyces sp. SID10815]|uniref:sensor histidine kinase n=1 Tax=Streptomyces sp. SID10815 TaxID=2706027 RepID=UPI0013C701CA|nr:sensor histidine kinase [Streptomyces sp. SID10815]NEA50007.1 sensor histidine kinase [Streptomyces sp. SID10815]